MSTATKNGVDPFTATTWGHPIFSSYVRKVASEHRVGARFDLVPPILRAVQEILATEVKEGEDGSHIWHLERSEGHVLDALKYLENAAVEQRREKGRTFPGGPPTWTEECEERPRGRGDKRAES